MHRRPRHPGLGLAVAIALAIVFGPLAGCGGDGGGGQRGGSAAGGSTAGGAGGAAAPTVYWLKGDLHNHTTISEDARRQMGDDLPTCIRLAEQVGLDYWALTDHRTTLGTRDPAFQSSSVILIPGEEWGSCSHAGALGITQDAAEVDKSQPAATWNAQVQQAVDWVHAQGGAFIANHPTDEGANFIWNVQDLDAIEVWNQFWAFRWTDFANDQIDDNMGADLIALGHAPYPALRAAASRPGGGKIHQALLFYEEMLLRGWRLALTGGGDRHMLVLPGHPTTWVGATDRTPAGVLEGIRRHRTSVSAHRDGPFVLLDADADRDGVFERTLGDEVPAGRPVAFRVRVERTDGGTLEIRRSGQTFLILRVPAGPLFETQVVDTPAPGDFYRVDYWEDVDPNVPGGAALTQAILAPGMQHPSFTSFTTYLALWNLGQAAQYLTLDLSYGTVLPALVLDRRYTRIMNLDLRDPTRSMAAVTSAIYAR